MSEGWVVPLSAIAESDRPRVGGKAAGLARLLGLGLPIPPGFCVTIAAYAAHARAEPVRARITALLAADGGARRALLIDLRRAFLATSLADGLGAEIEAALRALGAESVAVRSSAAAEDLAAHSFAGQHDTLLGVAGAASCREAIRACWASLWSDRAFDYRERNGFDHRAAAMAVVVQTLVPADAAGVLFTADPVTGAADRIVIEGSFGLGEAVASGKVAPDRVVLAKADLRVIEHRVAAKRLEIVADVRGGVIERAVTGAREEASCLDIATARRLAELALRVERAFGAPQDVEWAVRTGESFLLQARPITVRPAPTRTWEERQVWSNLNAGEVLPDVVSPMTWSIIARLIHGIFAQMLATVGIDLGANPLLDRIAGRAYFNLNTVLGVFRSLPVFRDQDVGEVLGGMQGKLLGADAFHIPPEDTPFVKFDALRLAGSAPGFVSWFFRSALHRGFLHVRKLRRENLELEAVNVGLSREDDLAERLLGMLWQREDFSRAIDFVIVGMMWFNGLFALCKAWLGDVDRALANRLLAGMGNMASAEGGLDLWRLAACAHERPPIAEAVLGGEPWPVLRERWAGSEGGRDFLVRWDAFLRDHGHHTRGELELMNPRWREDPEHVRDLVRASLRSMGGVDPVALHARRAAERVRLTAECRARLNPLKRALFDLVLVRGQQGCVLRENMKSELVRRLVIGRSWLLELGERMARRGSLDRRDDIFFLRDVEFDLVRRGKLDARPLVAARRAEYARDLALTPPPVVVGRFDPARHLPESVDADAEHFTGLAVSPGFVSGRARVILRADSEERVLPGEVLVAPFTDPGWTPYFLHAAAIVMDMGGLLSHGSIVAREYGIPCVVNVGPATRIIRTGQMLEVDGDRGRVRVVRS